jgi:hypothetical protein
MTTNRPIRVVEVRDILGVHYNTVLRIDPRELPYFRVGSRGDRRYLPEDVRSYVEKRTIGR